MGINKAKVDQFWSRRAKNISDERIATHFKRDDSHIFDLRLVEKYITTKSAVLDLACGTCYIANRLVDKVKFIKAVDKFGEFLKFAKKVDKLVTVEADIAEFKDSQKYDVILLFGIMVFFDEKATVAIYKKCRNLLAKNGTLIVKHQCGVGQDVVINHYSPQIGDHYHAVYKHLDYDISLLSRYFKVEIVDIYPPRLNPWQNTHFYAFVCKA